MGCRLIVNADDFGQSEDINEGVLRAYCNGILTSASVMANGRAFQSAAAMCRKYPTLDLGIHLTLLEEPPVSTVEAVPSLVSRAGRLQENHAAFLWRYSRGKIRLGEVEQELDAQIVKVFDAGLVVSHLDSHQHLHMLPGIWRIVTGLARKYGIPAVRFPRERLRPYMLSGSGRSFGRLAQLVALNSMCNFTGNRNSISADHFFGFFLGGRLNGENLRVILGNLPESGTCELMCHPGVVSDVPLYKGSGYNRRQELEALLDPRVEDIIRNAGIKLVSFRDLIPRDGAPVV